MCVSHSVVSDSLQPQWTVAHQAPLSMEFSRQEYWSGLLFPSSEDLPEPGIEPRSPALQADYERPETPTLVYEYACIFLSSDLVQTHLICGICGTG